MEVIFVLPINAIGFVKLSKLASKKYIYLRVSHP
jgi:hypothetical protein